MKKEELTEERKKLIQRNIKLYKELNSFVLSQKAARVYNEEMLSKCDKVLSINSEHYTVWNYRREIVLHLFETEFKASKEDQARLLNEELSTISKTLKRNPKSYSGFHHRVWCIEHDELHTIDLRKELDLCSNFLALDSRNFHCWDYRRFIVSKAGIKLKEELKYSRQLIEQNFSNYSAWHYRSTLIPLICKENRKKLRKRINSELEFVKNAFYTEPNDQSAWLYHRWLLGKDGYSTVNTMNNESELQSNVHGYELTLDELQAEFASIEEFLKVEPNSKWGLLTYCVLLQAFKRRGQGIAITKHKIHCIFQTLLEIDAVRRSYYLDVKDQLIQQLTASD